MGLDQHNCLTPPYTTIIIVLHNSKLAGAGNPCNCPNSQWYFWNLHLYAYTIQIKPTQYSLQLLGFSALTIVQLQDFQGAQAD
jgi:hypothetical protein